MTSEPVNQLRGSQLFDRFITSLVNREWAVRYAKQEYDRRGFGPCPSDGDLSEADDLYAIAEMLRFAMKNGSLTTAKQLADVGRLALEQAPSLRTRDYGPVETADELPAADGDDQGAVE